MIYLKNVFCGNSIFLLWLFEDGEEFFHNFNKNPKFLRKNIIFIDIKQQFNVPSGTDENFSFYTSQNKTGKFVIIFP